MSTDLWSIGCILYALFTGKPPFEGSCVPETLTRVKDGNFKLPSSISKEGRDLIKGLLTQNPKERITIRQVLSHPFLVKHCPDDLDLLINEY